MIEIEIRREAELLDESRPATPEEMRLYCEKITAEFLPSFSQVLLLLDGEPGAGKTTFCQGFRTALGIEDRVNSPTFNILNEYAGERGRLFHYDLYRLGSGAELLELDFLDRWRYVEESSDASPGSSKNITIHAVEWWQRAAEFYPFALPTFLLSITDVKMDEEDREVRLYRLRTL